MSEPLETRCIKRAVKREDGHCVVCHTVYDHEGNVLAEITVHRCKSCGREESVCSDDPCAAVLEDRGESIQVLKLSPADVVMLAHAAKVKW